MSHVRRRRGMSGSYRSLIPATGTSEIADTKSAYENFVFRVLNEVDANYVKNPRVLHVPNMYSEAQSIEHDIKNKEVEIVQYLTEIDPIMTIGFESIDAVTPVNYMVFYSEFEIVVVDYMYTDSFGTSHTLLFIGNDPDNAARLSKHLHLKNKERERLDRSVPWMLKTSRNGFSCDKLNKWTPISMNDVILDATFKDDIAKTVELFFNEGGDFYKKYSLPYKRGILLYGDPGNGKTTLIKAIVSECSAKSYYWQINEFVDSDGIDNVFNNLEDSEDPVILVIEDIDSLPDQVRSTFLNAIDGASGLNGVFIIATTNYPEKIDKALLTRAGRFDRAYEIKKPDSNTRAAYLTRKGLDTFVDKEIFDELVKVSDGFSTSSLNEIYTTVALKVHYGDTIVPREIVESLKVTMDKQRKGDFSEKAARSVGFM